MLDRYPGQTTEQGPDGGDDDPRSPTQGDLQARWLRCKAVLAQRLSREDAEGWLAGLHLRELAGERIVLGGIRNSFFRDRIRQRFRALILDGLQESFPELALGSGTALELRVERGADAAPPLDPKGLPTERPGSAAASMAPAEPGPADNGQTTTRPHDGATASTPGGPATPASRQTFDSFVPAPGNASALEFAQAAAAEPGRRFNPLLLVGQTGLGKSHLLQALAHALEARTDRPLDDQGVPAPVLYVTGEAFKNEVLDGITRKRMPALRERYRASGALLLDDLEFLLVSPKAQEELLHTFDVLHRAGRQLAFTTDRFPRALTGLSDALRSRLEAGLIAELTPPDEAARRRVVECRAADAGLTLPPDVADLLARRITRNLRRLEGAVVRLSAHAALHGRSITPGFAERYAAPFFDAEGLGGALPVARDVILERVADRFGLTVRALKGRGRSANLAGARRIAVHLLRQLGECSYSEIGTLLGNRSHSTIVHAHQGLQADMAQDSRLEQTVLQLTRELGEG